MADDQGIDWNVNVPILSPWGELHAIPKGSVQQALAQPGAKRAVPMVNTQTGEHHWVPEDQVQAAVGQGGRISWPSSDIPKWFGFTPGNVSSNVWSGAKGLVTGLGSLAADLANNPNWFEGSGSTYSKFIGQPAEQEVVKAGQALEQGQPVAAAGHALASAVPMVGPWAAGLGEQAGRGDVGGATGQAAGTIAAGTALAKAPGIVNKVIPSTTRSGAGISMLERQYAEHPIEPQGAESTISRFERELAPTPSVKVPPLIKDFQGRMMAAGPAGTEVAPGVLSEGPLTFAEARAFLKRANEARTYSGDIGDNMLASFADALSKDIQGGVAKPSAVAPQGFAADYNRMTTEYRRGSQIIRAGESKFGRRLGGAMGAATAYALAPPELPHIARYGIGAAGYGLTEPVVGSLVRSVIERQGGAPNISTPIPPPAPPPDVYTRNLLAQQELLRAKSGEITPGQANANIQRMGVSTKVQRIGQPPAPPTELERTAAALGVKPEPLPARPTPTQFGFNRAIETGPQGADVGAKVRAEQPPMPRGERRAVPRSAGQVELENLFRQARRELGDNATTEQVMARVEELKKAARGRKPGPPPPPTR